MSSIVVTCEVCQSPVESVHSVFSAVTKEHTFTARCHGEIDWCQVPHHLISADYGWKITEAVAFRDRNVSKVDTSKAVSGVKHLPVLVLNHQDEPVLEAEIDVLMEVIPDWAGLEGETVTEPDGGVCKLPRRDFSMMTDIPEELRCM